MIGGMESRHGLTMMGGVAMNEKFPTYPPTQAARVTRCPILLGFRDGNPSQTPTCDTTRDTTRRNPSKIGLLELVVSGVSRVAGVQVARFFCERN